MSPSKANRALFDQGRIERHTLDLLQAPAVLEARSAGEQALLASIPDADAASLELFPQVAVEIALNALIGFVDGRSGEDLPRLIMRPPHDLSGQAVPGNRGLHDNPDTFYRLIPLDGDSDFVLEGHVHEVPPTIVELSVLTAGWETIAHLTKSDLGLAPGDRFRIHLGLEPGPSVDHFLRSSPAAEMLLVRETLADWAKETPCDLSIENRAARGGPREHDDARYVEAAARRVEKWFQESIRLTQAPLERPPNSFPEPEIRNQQGMLITQAYSIGHFQVRPGEALVLTIDPGSAEYVAVPITNLWGTTGAHLARGSSLNSRQVAIDEDGCFRCVLSHEDPGIQNWLDPEGLERGFLFLRWAGLDPVRAPERAPGLSTRVVDLSELDAVLPKETIRVDQEARRAIRAARERDHARRFEILRPETDSQDEP